MALAQLADTGGTAAARDGGPAPAALLLPQSGTAHRDTFSTGNAAGQTRDASSAAAAGHCHLGRARLLPTQTPTQEIKKETSCFFSSRHVEVDMFHQIL